MLVAAISISPLGASNSKLPLHHNWVPPESGEFKSNFDRAMFDESDEAGAGVVIRDSIGHVIAAMAEKIRKPHSVECLEMVVDRHAVVFATEIGLQQCHFEGDSQTDIKALKSGDMFSSSFGHLVKDTLFYVHSMRSFSFSHIVRQGNAVAHALAQRARLSFPLLVWMKDVPSDVFAFVSKYFAVIR